MVCLLLRTAGLKLHGFLERAGPRGVLQKPHREISMDKKTDDKLDPKAKGKETRASRFRPQSRWALWRPAQGARCQGARPGRQAAAPGALGDGQDGRRFPAGTPGVWGVDRVFGYPGDGINGITGALGRQDKIDFIQVRHEEEAAFMASGHAKLTGEVGVCLATSGPGAIHLLNGLYDAKLDRKPVVAIVGQSVRMALGGHFQQEVDLLSLFKDVAGDFVQVCTTPEQARHLIDRAFRIAKAQRTVTAIIFPNDVQELAAAEPGHAHGTIHSGADFASRWWCRKRQDLQRAAEILNQGEKVAMLIGAGAWNAPDEVMAVCDKLQAGVAKALLGKAVLPDDLPYSHRPDRPAGHQGVVHAPPGSSIVAPSSPFGGRRRARKAPSGRSAKNAAPTFSGRGFFAGAAGIRLGVAAGGGAAIVAQRADQAGRRARAADRRADIHQRLREIAGAARRGQRFARRPRWRGDWRRSARRKPARRETMRAILPSIGVAGRSKAMAATAAAV